MSKKAPERDLRKRVARSLCGATATSSVVVANVRFQAMAKASSTADMRRKPVIQGAGLRSPLWVNYGHTSWNSGAFAEPTIRPTSHDPEASKSLKLLMSKPVNQIVVVHSFGEYRQRE